MTDNSKSGYLAVASNSLIQQHLAAQSQQKLKMNEPQVNYSLKVPQINHSQESFTMVPDDGLGYDDGVRVLRSIGTWYVIVVFDLCFYNTQEMLLSQHLNN